MIFFFITKEKNTKSFSVPVEAKITDDTIDYIGDKTRDLQSY